jgi:hypothetical protein
MTSRRNQLRRTVAGTAAAMFTLKRASKSRPTGQWSDDDYDVFDGDRRAGLIISFSCHLPPIMNGSLASGQEDNNDPNLETIPGVVWGCSGTK